MDHTHEEVIYDNPTAAHDCVECSTTHDEFIASLTPELFAHANNLTRALNALIAIHSPTPEQYEASGAIRAYRNYLGDYGFRGHNLYYLGDPVEES